MSNRGWHRLVLGMGLEEAGVRFGRVLGFMGLRGFLRTLGHCLGVFMDMGVMYKRSIDHIRSARIAYLNIPPLAEYEGTLLQCLAAYWFL